MQSSFRPTAVQAALVCRSPTHTHMHMRMRTHTLTLSHTHTHPRHTSAAQSNRSCLYMPQSVQYVWVVQYCVYTETVTMITCVCVRECLWAWQRVCVFDSKTYKYVCTETKLSEVWGIRFPQLPLSVDRVTSTWTCLFIHKHTLFLASYQMPLIYACLRWHLWPFQCLW